MIEQAPTQFYHVQFIKLWWSKESFIPITAHFCSIHSLQQTRKIQYGTVTLNAPIIQPMVTVTTIPAHEHDTAMLPSSKE